MILEEAENLELERIATVRDKRGREYTLNVDESVNALVDFLSDLDNEAVMGWNLTALWYADAISGLRNKMGVQS